MNSVTYYVRLGTSVLLSLMALVVLTAGVASCAESAQANERAERTVPLHMIDTGTGEVRIRPMLAPHPHSTSCYQFDGQPLVECYVVEGLRGRDGAWRAQLEVFHGDFSEEAS